MNARNALAAAAIDHDRAMGFAEQAFLARRRLAAGNPSELLRLAFAHEASAAKAVRPFVSLQPTRAVLLRSAASLALECGEWAEARQLAAWGLIGAPPTEIERELLGVMDQARFGEHLAERQAAMEESALWYSVDGPGVVSGWIDSKVISDRVQKIGLMIARTLRRLAGAAFAPGATGYRTYESARAAGSFSIEIRVLKASMAGQESLFPEQAGETNDTVIHLIQALKDGDQAQIEKSIPDAQYRANFLSLGAAILPDGSDITHVGLASRSASVTVIHNSADEDREAREALRAMMPMPEATDFSGGPPSEIAGTLLYADSSRRVAGDFERMRIRPDSGPDFDLLVPPSLRACSLCLGSEQGTASVLFRKYRRYGAYRWSDIVQLSGPKRRSVRAYRFAATELLPRPVPLSDLREILETFSAKLTANLAAPTKVPEAVFEAIYRRGLGI